MQGLFRTESVHRKVHCRGELVRGEFRQHISASVRRMEKITQEQTCSDVLVVCISERKLERAFFDDDIFLTKCNLKLLIAMLESS